MLACAIMLQLDPLQMLEIRAIQHRIVRLANGGQPHANICRGSWHFLTVFAKARYALRRSPSRRATGVPDPIHFSQSRQFLERSVHCRVY